jgi:hypothetical protein
VDIFAEIFLMNPKENTRLIQTLKAISTNNFGGLSKFIIDASNDGLHYLIENLINTRFLAKYSKLIK